MDFTIETTIARPPADVFAVLTDPERLPEWQPRVVEVEVVDGGPLRLGSRVREVRALRRRRLEQLVEIVAYDPPRAFGMKILEGPIPVDGDVTLTPAGGGATVVRLHAHGRAPGPLRFVEPLLTLAGRREMRRQYAALKALVEEGVPRVEGAGATT